MPTEPTLRTPEAPDRPWPLTESMALLERARMMIPGETVSLMKRPQMFSEGSFPVFLASGQGAEVTDVDGNRYIDYICGLGANTLGHNHPQVVAAVMDALPDGLSHSLPTALEVDVAAALISATPGAEMTRFFKTGADATSAAVRLARHCTGREKVVTVGYNGWHDHFMFDTPGVPDGLAQYTRRCQLTSPEDEAVLLELVTTLGAEFAAVVLSLPYLRCISRDFLPQLRSACSAHGVLLVLDEVVTGFRVAKGGAQELYGVEADLVCLSKGIAAGMPLSALIGPRRYMHRMDGLQVSTTFGGERLSLAACLASLRVFEQTDAIGALSVNGALLRDGVNRVSVSVGAPLRIVGYAAIPFWKWAPDPSAQASGMKVFVGEMARRGVLLRRDVNFMSVAHTAQHIEATIAAVDGSLRVMKQRGHF